MAPETIAAFCVIAGLSMLAGWWTTFRNRPYLAFLGGFFLALAGVLVMGGRLQAGEQKAALVWGLRGAVGLAAVLLGAALVTAVQESRQRIREVREHYRAAEEALLEMARVKQELARRQAEGGETPEAAPKQTPQDDEPGPPPSPDSSQE